MKKILYGSVFCIWYLMSLLPLRVLYILSDGLFYLIYYVVKYRRPLVRNTSSTLSQKKRGRAHQDREGILPPVLRLHRRNHQALHDEQEANQEAHAVCRSRKGKRILPERPVVRSLFGTLLQLGMGYFPASLGRRGNHLRTDLPCAGES